MKKIYYTDISRINIESIDLNLISKKRLDDANKNKIELKKIQSLVSYLLLRYAFKEYGINLNDYVFSYSKKNKPFIKDLPYHFNISHSKNILCVIISDLEVGIDCEYFDCSRNLTNLIKFSLNSDEMKVFNTLSSEAQYDYFYNKWVRIEAYYKMIGSGISKELMVNHDDLIYPIFKVKDALDEIYYITTTEVDCKLEKIEFNELNK